MKNIKETINNMTGANVETASFVSDKNTNVESVLFVLKTAPIEKSVPANTETKRTYWNCD